MGCFKPLNFHNHSFVSISLDFQVQQHCSLEGFSFCLGVMSGREENRIFVGGLGSDVTERQLEKAFECYGEILECQVPFYSHWFS